MREMRVRTGNGCLFQALAVFIFLGNVALFAAIVFVVGHFLAKYW